MHKLHADSREEAQRGQEREERRSYLLERGAFTVLLEKLLQYKIDVKLSALGIYFNEGLLATSWAMSTKPELSMTSLLT